MIEYEIDDKSRGLPDKESFFSFKQPTGDVNLQFLRETLVSKLYAILNLKSGSTDITEEELAEILISYFDFSEATISLHLSQEEILFLEKTLLRNDIRDSLNNYIRSVFSDEIIDEFLLPEIEKKRTRKVLSELEPLNTIYSLFVNSPDKKTKLRSDIYLSEDGIYVSKKDLYYYFGIRPADNNAVYLVKRRIVSGLPAYKNNIETEAPILLTNPDGTPIKFETLIQMATLVCGETAGFPIGFLHTAHTIRNRQVLRYAAKLKYSPNSYNSRVASDLHAVLTSCVKSKKTKASGPGYFDIEEYCSRTPFASRNETIKNLAIAACLKALTRSYKDKSLELGLQNGKWHSDDTSKGAIAWKGSITPVGIKHSKYKSVAAYKNYYRNIKIVPNVFVWDLPESDDSRFIQFENGVMAVYQKHTNEWVQYMKSNGKDPWVDVLLGL